MTSAFADCAGPPTSTPRATTPQRNRFIDEALARDSDTWTPAASVIASANKVKRKMGILEVLRCRYLPLSAGGVQAASVLLAAVLHNHRRIAAFVFLNQVRP